MREHKLVQLAALKCRSLTQEGKLGELKKKKLEPILQQILMNPLWNRSRSAALGSLQLVKQLSKDERLIRQ